MASLRTTTTWYDFYIINSTLNRLCSKEKQIVSTRQQKKLRNLCKGKSVNESFDPDKLIYNFSDHQLTEAQKSVLLKGLKFGLPPTKVKDIDILVPFELLYGCLKGLDSVDRELTKEQFKHKFADQAYTYHNTYDHEKVKNLTDDELRALKELKEDRDIVILKADKGNCTVILRKVEYISRLETMLQDTSKFKLLPEDPTIQRENKLIRHLLSLKKKGVITEAFYDRVRPNGSQPARLYGLPKIHKPNHPLRPICSSTNSYNYNLSSELASILSPYTNNGYSVKNTFTFVKEIHELDLNSSYVCSFDVSSLFTSIPLDETIEIALDYVFEEQTTINGLNRKQLKKLVVMATKETHFMFNNNVYDQIDGVAMGSPLAPVLANLFMRHFEEEAFRNFEGNLPRFYRRYVDDSFVIFDNQSEVLPFYQYINTLHQNIVFTKEEESVEEGFFPFLDVRVMKLGNAFTTSTFYKPTHTGLYTNWYSFTPRKYKINLVKCLLFRAWNICSNATLFKEDCKVIKTNLMKNQFPEKLLDSIITNFVSKQTSQTAVSDDIHTVPKKELLLVLPYLGHEGSRKLNRNLTSLISKVYPQVDLRFCFRTTVRIANLFRFKDTIPKRFKSFVVYGVHCTDCDAFYVGKTKRHLITRFKEHTDVRKPTAVTEHVMRNNHNVIFDDVEVIEQGKTDKELLIKESLTVKRLKPVMNNNVASFPLEIF